LHLIFELGIITKDKIFKIAYDKNSIYIYLGLNMACIIKNHFFDTEEKYNELKLFMKGKY